MCPKHSHQTAAKKVFKEFSKQWYPVHSRRKGMHLRLDSCRSFFFLLIMFDCDAFFSFIFCSNYLEFVWTRWKQPRVGTVGSSACEQSYAPTDRFIFKFSKVLFKQPYIQFVHPRNWQNRWRMHKNGSQVITRGDRDHMFPLTTNTLSTSQPHLNCVSIALYCPVPRIAVI